jgi:hypothetical protein
MKMSLKAVSFIVLVYLLLASFALGESRHELNFPDILDCKTLKCDFHIHTVFSDGLVWPTVRVDEAWRDGLDAISITDHVEYHPHKRDIPTAHNRPYEIAAPRAKEKNILLVRGAEITRDTPPGHFNAIFLKEITPLDTNDVTPTDINDFVDTIRLANEQGGFVFWNHPGWKPEAKGWLDIHTKLYENKWLKGIEVVNGDTYYPEAHRWCLEKNLTMLGNSDVHDPITGYEIYEDPELTHRPITLVFAKEKTAEALKEALLDGRTAVWHKNQLIGREKYLDAIFKAAVKVARPHYRQKDTVWFEIRNNLCMDIQMGKTGTGSAGKLVLPANSTTLLSTGAKDKAGEVKLSYVVKNFLIAPDKGLPVELIVPLQ